MLKLKALRRRRTFAVALTFGLALTAVGCRGASDETGGSEGTDPYRVGALLGLTGNYAALGEPERNSIELCVDNLNADGGINGREVKLIVADSGSDETQAVNQLRKLTTQDQAHVVLGPSSSGESIALKPVAKSLKIPVLSLASSEEIVTPISEAEYMFKQFPSTTVSLKAQLQFAEDNGWKRVAILGVNTGYGQEPVQQLSEVIKKFDLELVSSELFPPGATNVTAQLTRIARSNPDVVLVWAVTPSNAVVARSAGSIGLEATLLNSPGAGSAGYIETAGAAANGTLVQGSKILVPDDVADDDPQDDVITAFVNAYEKASGNSPGQFAGNGWDGCRIITEAIKATDPSLTDTQEIRDAIRASTEKNVQDLPGVNAIYTYGAETHGPSGIEGLAVLGVENQEFTLEKAY